MGGKELSHLLEWIRIVLPFHLFITKQNMFMHENDNMLLRK